jgi:hypothetical protein
MTLVFPLLLSDVNKLNIVAIVTGENVHKNLHVVNCLFFFNMKD